MVMAWRGWWLAGAACAVLAFGCGDDSGGDKKVPPGGKKDGAVDPRDAGDQDAAPPIIDAGGRMDAGLVPDAALADVFNPFDYDANGDYQDANGIEVAGPVPVGWSCPDALWDDGYCDCGCTLADWDCKQFSCVTPGCIDDTCEACFTTEQAWKPCESDPDTADWLCKPAHLTDDSCDCGCGIPDPECGGKGCIGAGCYTPDCDRRHGCDPGVVTAASDICDTQDPLEDPVPNDWPCAGGGSDDDCRCTCDSNRPPAGWLCPDDFYAGNDGCDCGCGVLDPDCAGEGCTASRCHEDSCDRCNFGEAVDRRPYDCRAAQAGWDDDILSAAGSQASTCSSSHFDRGDGCDCGCGGLDPDCDGDGCELPGCETGGGTMCDRCTDSVTREPGGCAIPQAWFDNQCNAANYGTGDGCDCGCGVADPDCAVGQGSTDPNMADDNDCDVCNDGAGFFRICPEWACQNANAFSLAQCDCGCGLVDPYCRQQGLHSCTGAGCTSEACLYTNEEDTRTSLVTQWQTSGCELSQYGVDGLCDCGCGAHDPDCVDGDDCVGQGCVAPACEVCHTGSTTEACYPWTCDLELLDEGTDGDLTGNCDCGCGADDPDCGSDGCRQPGCSDSLCDVCHDPYGRAVPCPL